MKTILIIDTFNLLFRSYYAMRSFTNSRGEGVGMLMGLANQLAALPDGGFSAVVFAADSPGGSFRNELHAEYKANRKELEPSLREQLPRALGMLASAGYALIERPGFEADDIIASLVREALAAGFERVIIASTDKDLYGLISERVSILGRDGALAGVAQCVEKFGVPPEQMRDYLALIGDSADNFKGVPGVGPAAARKLLAQFGSLEGIYANLARAGTKGLIAKLEAGRESALLSQRLATLRDEIDLAEAVRLASAPDAAALSERLVANYARLAGDFERYELRKHAAAARQMAASDAQAPGGEMAVTGKKSSSADFGADFAENSSGAKTSADAAENAAQNFSIYKGNARANTDENLTNEQNHQNYFSSVTAGNEFGANQADFAPARAQICPRENFLILPDGTRLATAASANVHFAHPAKLGVAGFCAHLITDVATLAALAAAAPQMIGFDTETTGLSRRDRCVGFSFAFFLPAHTTPAPSDTPAAPSDTPAAPQNPSETLHAFYVPLAHICAQNIPHDAAAAAISELFRRCVIAHNLAFDLGVISREFAIQPPADYACSMLLCWLADTTARVGLDAQCEARFAHINQPFSELVAKGSHFGELAPESAFFYAAEDAAMSLLLARSVRAQLSAAELDAARLEMRLLRVIFDMAERGITCSARDLAAAERELAAEHEDAKRAVFAAAGREFNEASPKQLAEVLYDELALPAPRNRSTAEGIISQLDHPIIAPILRTRAAAKLLGTYVRPLQAMAARAEDEFIVRASWLQHGTATGRLACAQPNLQNLPARGHFAQLIKSAFKARAGCVFVSLDYSQIELRMLAHFSADAALLEAFAQGADIHARTAAECFGDASKRQLAKAINFGLIYGMGARTLAGEIGTSTAEAKRYIEAYFARFGRVQEFFAATRARAREQGFISTLVGRRRYFAYNQGARGDAAADREAVNSVLQGSAADLIKLAMIRAHEMMAGYDAQLLLQVHDELIFELPKERASEFAAAMSALMCNAAPLRVVLATESTIGRTLAELKKA